MEKNPLKQSHLDFILISENLSNLVETFLVKPGYRSDHSSNVLEIKYNVIQKGRDLWKKIICHSKSKRIKHNDYVSFSFYSRLYFTRTYSHFIIFQSSFGNSNILCSQI